MILVTGATGNVGSELVRCLGARHVDMRLLVRYPSRVDELPERAELAIGDWCRPETLAPAFAGIESLFLLLPGIGIDVAAAAIDHAKAAGVGRIVLLSSYNVLGDPMPAMGRWHQEREQVLAAAGIPFTIIRPGGFMSNALEWIGTIREGGYVLNPIGAGKAALIDPADIAAVAALALVEPRHQGERYTLTGDEPLTVAEQVATLSRAVGFEIEVRSAATPEEALRFRYPDGAPTTLAAALLEGLTLMRADTTGFQTDTVSRLLGRRPRNFAEWCARNAAAFPRPVETAGG
jgi:uncharacterized protein YbjT (DUF2867 family)